MTNQQDIVIITALGEERDAVLRYLDNPEKVQTKNRIVYKSNLRHDDVDSSCQVVFTVLKQYGRIVYSSKYVPLRSFL